MADSKPSSGKRRPLLGMLLVAAVLTTWFYLHQQGSLSRQPEPVPAAALPAESAQPAAVTASAMVPAVQEPASSAPSMESTRSIPSPELEAAAEAERVKALNAHNARLNQQRIERERRERRERLQAQEQARAAQELEQQRAEQARRQAQIAPARPPVTVPAPVRAVAPPLTVARICDEAGNFFAREVCRVRECRKASQANDPVCVSFRKIEEANRARELSY